jgi:acid phosphatase (class A)
MKLERKNISGWQQWLSAVVLLALVAAAQAQTQTQARRGPYYVVPTQVALDRILPPPPAPDSKEQKQDLEAMLKIQSKRSKAEVQEATADVQVSVFRFADVLGPQFNAEKLPFTAQFFRRIFSDAGQASSAAKDHFNRPRPYAASSKVNPAIDKPPLTSASYPSGHAMVGYSGGIVLAIIVPEKSRELFARAERYARNRVVGGVHYPTDVESGRIAASIVVNAMLQNQQFLADLEQAKAEVRTALGLELQKAASTSGSRALAQSAALAQ